MAHHGSRETLLSKSKLPEEGDDDQRKSLIRSLKNAMSILRNQPVINSEMVDGGFSQAYTKNEVVARQSASNFNRRSVMSPTMIVHTLMTLEQEVPK